MKQIVFLKEYLSKRFGKPVQRIPIDLGLSCPNRNPDGSGGCAFCGEGGSRARHLSPGTELARQVAQGIQYVHDRYASDAPYAAYFQAFTATNADPATLRKLYHTVLAQADFCCVIIATRPDCLPDDVIDVICELSDRYEVWVELGVQTANDATLKAVNRGHDFAAVKDAANRLHERGIKIAAHVILGLPGEDAEDYANTAAELSKLPFSAVKVHNLLVLKGTRMEMMYNSGKVRTMNEYEYANVLAGFLKALPEGWIVMRLCADAPQESVVSPRWWMNKGAFTDMFVKMYASGDTSPDCMKAVETQDGSYTFYHPKYRQHFHSTAGAWEESLRKYIQPCRIREKLETGKNISILDIGFGMGYNVSAAVELAESIGGKIKVYITTLEADENALDAAMRLPEHKRPDIVRSLIENSRYESANACVELLRGDARESVRILNAHYDYIFLDGFSPDVNPELWTLDFIQRLKSLIKPAGLLASYSSAYPFRSALIKNQFKIYESKPFGRRRGGTVASLEGNPWLPPLTEKEYLIATCSTAGTCYRDPLLRWNRQDIIENRKQKVSVQRASGMPKWYKGRASKDEEAS